jgi:hypothetical protein
MNLPASPACAFDELPISEYWDGPVWNAFGLTYAAYAVFPRRVLQSMPLEWQQKFVALIDELDETFPQHVSGEYTVLAKKNGKFVKDPMRDYRHAGPISTQEAGV